MEIFTSFTSTFNDSLFLTVFFQNTKWHMERINLRLKASEYICRPAFLSLECLRKTHVMF